VLLIVIEDEETQLKQAGENAADDFPTEVRIPDSPSHGGGEQEAG